MRRIAIISALGVAALVLIALLASAFVFHTPPGRAMLVNIAERELGKALNSEATIGALEGAPPGHIKLRDVRVSDEAGPWLTANEIDLRWRPFALLGKKFIIDSASIDGAYLLRNPPKGEPVDDARRIKVVKKAPNIDLKSLEFSDIRVNINGAPQRIDGAGALRLNGTDIALRITLTSEGERDLADITFEKSPGSDRLYIDATLNAKLGGAIATLLDLQGPVHIEAKADSPMKEAAMSLNGTVGYYGDISAELSGDLTQFAGGEMQIDIMPGTRFDGITELSAPVSLDAHYDAKKNGGALNLRSLTSAIGEIKGDLAWQAPRGFVDVMDAKLSVALNEAYRPELQAYAGETLDIDSQFKWRRDDYTLDATVTAPRAVMTIAKGTSDLRRYINGDITLDLAANDSSALLRNGINLQAAMETNFTSVAEFKNAKITTGDGSRYGGDAAYGFNDKSIALSGDVLVTKEMVSILAPGMAAEGNITGDVKLEGPLDRFTLSTAFEAPVLRMKSGAIPAMTVDAALSGLPNYPNGDVTARASNGGPRKLDLQLRASESGEIRIPKILYAGRGFNLGGTAAIEPNRQTLNLELRYAGEEAAEPWPGFVVTGDLNAAGVLSRDGALNNLTARSDALAYNNIAANGLVLTAQGPPGAISVTLESDVLSVPGVGPLAELNAAAQVDARGALSLTLTALDALIGNDRTHLNVPARISFADGVTVENLRLAYGAKGVAAFDGTISPQHWKAQINLANINIPNADGQLSLSLNVDTNASTPARGTFKLRSLLVEDDIGALQGDVVWNATTIRLTDQESDASLDMDVSLPARLIKSPKLTVDTSGALDGRIHYDGDVQTLAAYLPPVLQSIEGKFAADFTIAGSLADPDLSGSANLKDGAYTEVQSGFSLIGLHAQSEANYRGADSVIAFSGGARGAGQTRDDAIAFTGDVKFGENSNLNLEVILDRAELAAHPINNVRADGSLTVSGPFDALVAKGDISIIELDAESITPENTGLVDIEVVTYNDEGAPPDLLAPRKQAGIDYAIHLAADDRIFIRGRGLESEWSADVNAVNGREQPLILGKLTLRRGWLDFSGRRFELSRGAISFDRFSPNNPVLDISAELAAGDGVTARIVISGRAQKPTVSLESTPSLPSEDVMSLILFGKPAQELSPFESLQTAEALASLGGIGPFGGEGLTGRLRRSVGLDLLNIDVDPENGGGSLTVGKYVADGFFVSASQDAAGKTGSVRVKYEITDNITVETEIEQTGDQTVSANWKTDF